MGCKNRFSKKTKSRPDLMPILDPYFFKEFESGARRHNYWKKRIMDPFVVKSICCCTMYIVHMARSILNVHSKSITSPIFFKFGGHLLLAIKWWHANFENDRITFRAFLGRFTGVTLSVPKKWQKQPQFFNCSSSISNYPTVIFFISK